MAFGRLWRTLRWRHHSPSRLSSHCWQPILPGVRAALGPIRPSGELPFVLRRLLAGAHCPSRRGLHATLPPRGRPTPEQVEQRLTQEFVARYAPGAKYTKMAASGFLDHVLMSEVFGSDWRTGERDEQRRAGVTYLLQKLTGTFDPRYPDRRVTLALTSVQQSQAPDFENWTPRRRSSYASSSTMGCCQPSRAS